MSQVIFSTINASTTSGNQLATILNNFKDAYVTGNSGTSRPTELDAGGTWLDTSNDPTSWALKFYDGSVDILLFTIDLATGIASIGVNSNLIEIDKSSDDAVGAILKFFKKRPTGNQTQAADVLAELDFYGNTDADVEALQARIKVVSSNNVTSSVQGSYMLFEGTTLGASSMAEWMRLVDGKLAIGTTTADETLHVKGTGAKIEHVSDDAVGVKLVHKKKRITGVGQVQSADVISTQSFHSADNTGADISVVEVEVAATELHTSSAQGSNWKLKTKNNGSATLTTKITVDNSGVDIPELKVGSVSNTEISYLDGVTSAIQTQLNTEAAARAAADALLIPLTQKGAASGVAPLNSSSKIDSTYLPSYVDDVLEYADLASLPVSGATGIIYVTLDTNKTYRWTGSVYVEVSPSLTDALLSSTAFTLSSARHFEAQAATDSSTTGADAVAAAFTAGSLRFTNASLTSLATIPAGSNGQQLWIFNRTGAAVTIKDSSDALGTAANRILTGTGTSVTWSNDSAMILSYDSTTARWQIVGGTGSGTGSGGINYITNYNFEAGVSGWAAYTNAVTATMTIASPAVITVASTTGYYVGMPVLFTTTGALPTGLTAGTTYYISTVVGGTTFKVAATAGGADINTSGSQSGTHTFRPLVPITGTGGSPTLTFTRTTTAPLRGVGSGLATKSAADIAGDGFSYYFTIDSSDQGKVLQGSFEYQIASGTFVDGDLTAWIYDLVNGTAIPCVPGSIKNSGIIEKFAFEFQTAISSTQYRLVIHCASNSASAYTFKVDNFFVGPNSKLFSTAETMYSANVSAAGVISNLSKANWITGNAVVSGTSTYTITIPAGIFTVIPNCVTTNTADYRGKVLYRIDLSTATSLVFVGVDTNTDGVLAQPFSFYAHKQGVDYSNATAGRVSSSEADTRVVSAKLKKNATQSVTANVTNVTFPTTVEDTHGGWSSDTYTVKVPGNYTVTGAIWDSASSDSRSYVYVNGTAIDTTFQPMSVSAGGALCVAGTVKLPNLKAGDLITVRLDHTLTISTGGILQIEKVSGPSQIMASESVSALYTGNPPTGTITGSYNLVTYGTKIKDTHNAYSGGTYTIPVSGAYDISAQLSYSGTSALNKSAYVAIWIDGVNKYNNFSYAGGAQSYMVPHVSINSVPLLAGQLVTIRSFCDETSPTFQADATAQYFSINRSGNY